MNPTACAARATACPAARHGRTPPKSRRGLCPLPLAAAVATCMAAWVPGAQAQTAGTAPAADGAAAQRVVVTGSHIRRTDTETPSPVLTLSAQDIARSGYSSIADVLGSLSANNMGALGQASPAAFGAGGSGVSLRGLTVGATLVLIDGQRMAAYPLPDDGQRDFVDINSIPIDAVERIEVLKDGASAIYGSDAMAGVINVILKKQHTGTTLQAQVGSSSRGDGRLLQLSGIRGFGSARDAVSGYLSADYKRRSPILLSDRPWLTTQDWSRYGGEPNGPAPDNAELQVAPRTETWSLLGRLNARLSADWALDISASALSSASEQVGLRNTVSPGSGITSFVFGASHPEPTPTTLNGTNVIDPATGQPVDATLDDLGVTRSRTRSRSYRLATSLSGTWGDWEVNANAGLTRVATRLTMRQFVSLPALQAALNDGRYTLSGAANGAAVIAELTPVAESTSTNDLQYLNLRASREVARLPGGALMLGTGAELIHRRLSERFPEPFANGTQSSNIYAFGVGSQSVRAAYLELQAPLLKTLELDAALRHDQYVGSQSATTPKLGLKFSPLPVLTLRGTYAEGFRAPNPVESGVSGSSAGFLPPLLDTQLCALTGTSATCTIGVGGTQLQLPGQNLKPERSRSHTLGLLFEPVPEVNLSLDYYDIRIRDQIISVGLFGQAQIDNPGAYGTQLYRVNSPTTPNAAPTDANDTILYGTYPFLNVGQTRTTGFDLDLRGRFNAGSAGRFSVQLQWSHMIRYTIDRDGQRYELSGTHGPSFVSTNTGAPRDRAALSLSWARGPFELTGTLQHISAFVVTDPSYDTPDCSSALAYIYPNGAPADSPLCRVGAFNTVNLSLRHRISPQLQWRLSVVNLFDARPPVDAFASSSAGGGVASGGAHYNPALHQEGAVGRYLSLGASYSF